MFPAFAWWSLRPQSKAVVSECRIVEVKKRN